MSREYEVDRECVGRGNVWPPFSTGLSRTVTSIDPRPDESSMKRIVALAVAVILVVLAVATVAPPIAMPMLILSVGATELSPLLALASLAWLPVALVLLRGHRVTRGVAGAGLLLAGALSMRPLAQFAATAHRAGAQLGGAAPGWSPTAMLRGEANAAGMTEQSIRYAAADGSPLTLRLYRGAAPGLRPTVVVIYGGAWRGGDPSQGERVSRALASRGFTVAAIDYRHAPRFRYPAQLDDVGASLALLSDSSRAWAIDTTRIALLGRSAGGHLAELAAFTPGRVAVRAVVAIYSPFDLVKGYDDRPSPDPLDVRAVLRDFLGGTPVEQPARYRDASPSAHVRPGLPPVLLLYGARDHAVKPSFNRDAAAALRAAGGRVVQVEIPWAEHGFDLAPGGLGAQLGYEAVVRFLEREMAP